MLRSETPAGSWVTVSVLLLTFDVLEDAKKGNRDSRTGMMPSEDSGSKDMEGRGTGTALDAVSLSAKWVSISSYPDEMVI